MYHRITGEYWITEDGDIEYVDGDMQTHESLVIDHCRYIISELLMVHDDWNKAEDILSQYTQLPPELGIDPDIHAIAMLDDRSDPRQYALKVWGWKRVANNDVETWTLTNNDKRIIAKGIQNIIDEESVNEDSLDAIDFADDDPDIYIGIYVHTTRKTYEFELHELLATINKPTIDAVRSNTAANNQINMMMRSTQPNYYKNKPFGDDILRNVYALIEDNHGDSWNLLTDFKGTIEAIVMVEKMHYAHYISALADRAREIVNIIKQKQAAHQQEILDYPDDPPGPIPKYLCAGTIYGDGGWHRYHVGFDGTVYFSKRHCDDRRDLQMAMDMGFAIR